MQEIQSQRENLNQHERNAFQDFLRESGMDNDGDDDPTVMQTIKDRLSEVWRGPAFGKKEVFNSE